jgi:hypothetical protein
VIYCNRYGDAIRDTHNAGLDAGEMNKADTVLEASGEGNLLFGPTGYHTCKAKTQVCWSAKSQKEAAAKKDAGIPE